MEKKFVFFVIFTLAIAACSNNSEVPYTQIPELTQTLEPTLTPTLIPLSEIQLEEIVIKDGDLPAGYSGAQIRDIAPAMFDDVPKAQNTYYQQFAKDGDTKGGVTIFLFESQEDNEIAYNQIYDGLSDEAKELDEIGDKGYVYYTSMDVLGSTMQFGDLLFKRCNAVVHVRMTDVSSEDSLLAYAKRLDGRLIEIVCP